MDLVFKEPYNGYSGTMVLPFLGKLTSEMEEWLVDSITGLASVIYNLKISYVTTPTGNLQMESTHCISFSKKSDLVWFKMRFL